MSGVTMNTFNGQKLRDFMLGKGLTCADLSVMVKKDNSYISRCIAENRINSTVYELMCIKLGVDPDYFIDKPEPKAEVITDHTVTELLEENNRLLRELISMWRTN